MGVVSTFAEEALLVSTSTSEEGHKLEEIDQSSSSSAKALQVVRLLSGQVPPPSTMGFACVYVLRLADNTYYVGETDNITQRFGQHQKHHKRNLKEFAFVKFPKGGKSLARMVETRAIQQMSGMGFDMLSDTDGTHTNFAQVF